MTFVIFTVSPVYAVYLFTDKISSMSNYLDQICLFIICCIFTVALIGDPFSVVGFLSAVAAVCGAASDRSSIRISLQIAFALASCFSPAFIGFLPVVVYAMMHERPWAIRLFWIIPILVQGIIGGFTDALLYVTALCTIASLMAIKDARSSSEHASLQRAYDSVREESLVSKSKTRMNNDNDDLGDPGDVRPHHDAPMQEGRFFEGLTQRELAVVHLVAEGMDNREISQKLFLSEGTVRNHISSILSKKGLQNRTQIAVMYYRG